jgi:voltage-gated potassium channel
LESLRLLKYVFIALALVLVWGTLGYMLIEHAKFLDAVYMTVISITTVGYGEIFHLSQRGRIFTMLLIMAGLGVILVSFGVLTQIAVEGSLRRIWGRRRLEKTIAKLKNHFILCGSGRIGSLVVRELREMNLPLVVIERNPQVVEELTREGVLVLSGSATDEETLEQANIQQAKGLIVTVSSDAEAVFIILSARNMNPDLFIIARDIGEGNERKLKQAGANRVISPYRLMGKRMVNALLRPAVIDMLDTIMFGGELDLAIEGTEVYSNSPLAGQKLRDSGIRQKLGLIIIGIQQANGNIIFNPSPDEEISPGDTLISVGEMDAIRRLADWLQGKNLDL